MHATRDPQARLSVRDLRKSFGRRVVLDGVDLDVAPGSIVLLTGDNGSGKTTLLRSIAGLARHAGEVRLDGEPRGRAARGHGGIGYLPQAVGLPAWATVTEVLDLFARLRGTSVSAVGLPARFLPPLGQRAGELSGGQRQRVAVAIALLGAPRLLLLDEPTANLDGQGREAVVALVAAAREAGTSALIAAPSPDDLDGVCDRTVRLAGGRIARASGAGRVLPATAGRPLLREVAR